ncbi:MAG: hypothetical protein PHH11_00230 [Methylomonas sp.]|nr:hypothetical protein [Methylomonas sp.]
MKKQTIILISSALVLVLAAFKVISAEDAPANLEKSIAWYVANVKEAKAKNQQCHDYPAEQSADDCANALHALEISFKGGN